MNPSAHADHIADESTRAEIRKLLPALVARAPSEAARILDHYPDDFVSQMLESLNPALAQSVLERFAIERRQKIIAAAPPAVRQQWIRNEVYPENAIGHMMEPALAVFHPDTTVAEATRELRHFVTRAFITYVFVVDNKERLRGVVAMREMLLAGPEQRLDEIMIVEPFYLTPKMQLVEAMKATMVRHYPVYPVCDADGKLIGLIRGQMLFEAETVRISPQACTVGGR
jgi:magnesium transporter